VLDAVGPPGCASGHERGGEKDPASNAARTRLIDRVWVWGVPFASLSMVETVSAIGDLIEAGRPTYFITGNVHYAMLSHENSDLRVINAQAAFILADGAPLVWASRWQGTPLPERVAGADLIFELSAEAARKGYRLFLLGGADGVAEEAARRLRERYPGLKIVGTECPPFRQSTPEEEADLIKRIRAAKADILFVAFGQPKGERWINRNLQALAVPVSVQVGASLDFAADRVRRAPRWMQKCGLEWAFRLGLEPRRLFGRYVRNARFIARMIAHDMRRATSRTHTPL
jgi:N-acetylglucosaminyldiphosphoundecaprenol N-acetyl-beta-D-mannosaminyltransferase